MEENEIDDTDLEPRGSSGWFSWFQCGRPRASPPAPPLRLQSCLAAFFMRECLTGDERIECDSCKTLVECEKSLKYPSSLPCCFCTSNDSNTTTTERARSCRTFSTILRLGSTCLVSATLNAEKQACLTIPYSVW